ncbi:MAG TPA: DUF4230 domain-containing protein [Chloroflexi bacterium]|nr:DUF4230 domain-containing protein [Chloroflexota bacterium]
MKSNVNLNTVLLALVLIALIGVIVGGFALVGTIRQLMRPLEQIQETWGERIEEIVHPTPTILPDPVTIVYQVSSLSRLETVSYMVEKVITAESGQGPFAFLFGDRLILVAHGRVIAGVDLGKMTVNDIIVAENDTVIVTLPPAEVLVVHLNNQESYIFDRDTGLIGVNPALETEARRAAEQEILNAALEDGILNIAQENAEAYVRQLILALGFREVIFAHPSPTPIPTATP